MHSNLHQLESLFQEGTQHFHAGRFSEAYQAYIRCNDIRPVTADILNALGLSAFMLKRFELSVHWFEALLRLAPDNAEARLNLGSALFELSQFEAALACYDSVVASEPQNAQAWYNRGVALRQLKQLDEAQASYLRAIALNPDYPEAYSNLGVVHHERGEHQQALDCYNRAHTLKPDYAEAYSNAGATFMALADYEASLKSYEAALLHNAALPSACWNKGILLLLKGNLEQGLPLYEWRFHHQRQALFRRPLTLQSPRLTSTDRVAGKTVFIYDEQGLGDTIQMARYVTLLAQRGARVVLRAAQELHGLFKNLEGMQQLLGDFDDIPEHDFQCPMMSLPLACGTTADTIPAAIPYLYAPPDKVRHFAQLLVAERARQKDQQPKVQQAQHPAHETSSGQLTPDAVIGLVWAGNPRNPTDARRSIRLSELISHLPPGPLYVAMQRDVSEQDRALLASRNDILDLSLHLKDFADTAALCMCVTRMVCVDTSVAHLAGALGVPTDLMISCVPDWRWMLQREDTPWYPTVSLLRQPTPGDWSTVLKRLKISLETAYLSPVLS